MKFCHSLRDLWLYGEALSSSVLTHEEDAAGGGFGDGEEEWVIGMEGHFLRWGWCHHFTSHYGHCGRLGTLLVDHDSRVLTDY